MSDSSKNGKDTKAPIKCKINNVWVEVPHGTNIISAFKKVDQEIAYYCWHPGLSVAGVCRLCMVDIEGIPKLQIACNTEVKEGMVISNQTEKVKEAVRWGLEFHLINHPLDCPICDQSGECGLQDQYMKFGRYRPGMAERKVKKRKVIDLGPKIVLDSERCILCSRCVRFTDEVSKTHELGIFNRGDHSEIGIFKDKPLDNNYAINTVDICPVGALTSKDFRFRQRVWYLKTANSVCTGCSTGCNTYVDYNEEGIFRVRPRYNKKINGYWMCDKGRELFSLPNPKGRLKEARVSQNNTTQVMSATAALELLKTYLQKNNTDKKNSPVSISSSIALILTAQYTVEEYRDLISFFIKHIGNTIYQWQNNLDSINDFDGLLLRGDKNPNTRGLTDVLKEFNTGGKWQDLQRKLQQGEIDMVWVAGPENQAAYLDIEEKARQLDTNCKRVVWWTAHPLPVKNLSNTWQIPTKTFFEKSGSFVNYAGITQKLKAERVMVPDVLSLSESIAILKGEYTHISDTIEDEMKTNYLTKQQGAL